MDICSHNRLVPGSSPSGPTSNINDLGRNSEVVFLSGLEARIFHTHTLNGKYGLYEIFAKGQLWRFNIWMPNRTGYGLQYKQIYFAKALLSLLKIIQIGKCKPWKKSQPLAESR